VERYPCGTDERAVGCEGGGHREVVRLGTGMVARGGGVKGRDKEWQAKSLAQLGSNHLDSHRHG
jgi:hypothetical protein